MAESKTQAASSELVLSSIFIQTEPHCSVALKLLSHIIQQPYVADKARIDASFFVSRSCLVAIFL